MNDLIDVDAMRSAMGALAQAAPSTGGFGGRSLLKVEKHSGIWVFGAEVTELDGLVAIDPMSFEHGWVVWNNSAVQAESMVPLNKVPAERPAGADSQLSFTAAVVDGPDAGVQLIYKNSSKGGMEFVVALAGKIATASPASPVAIVSLYTTSYKHRSYGKIYKPAFKVDRWTTVDGEAAAEALEEAEPEEKAQPARRQRRTRSA